METRKGIPIKKTSRVEKFAIKEIPEKSKTFRIENNGNPSWEKNILIIKIMKIELEYST